MASLAVDVPRSKTPLLKFPNLKVFTAKQTNTIFWLLTAPGMPPENVYAANKSTPTTIPVTWQPISNQYFVHGILRGYTVTYRAISNPNQRLDEKERNITVGPNTTSVVLNKLSSFTIYSIEVRAFTVKGNGIPSQVIFAGNEFVFGFSFEKQLLWQA